MKEYDTRSCQLLGGIFLVAFEERMEGMQDQNQGEESVLGAVTMENSPEENQWHIKIYRRVDLL